MTRNDLPAYHFDAARLHRSHVRSTACINRMRHAREDLVSGAPVLLVDDDGGHEAVGYVVICAERARVGAVSFLVRHSSGYLCVAMESERCRQLGLPPAWDADASDHGPIDYRVTVDAATGIGTGISAADRARTAQLLADSATGPADLTRPGHVVPVAAAATGALTAQAGAPELALELVRATGTSPVAMYGAVVGSGSQTSLPSRRALLDFAAQHSLTVVTRKDIRTALVFTQLCARGNAVLVEKNDAVVVYELEGLGLDAQCYVVASAQLPRGSEVGRVEIQQIADPTSLLAAVSRSLANPRPTDSIAVYVSSTDQLIQLVAPVLATQALKVLGCTASPCRERDQPSPTRTTDLELATAGTN